MGVTRQRDAKRNSSDERSKERVAVCYSKNAQRSTGIAQIVGGSLDALQIAHSAILKGPLLAAALIAARRCCQSRHTGSPSLTAGRMEQVQHSQDGPISQGNTEDKRCHNRE